MSYPEVVAQALHYPPSSRSNYFESALLVPLRVHILQEWGLTTILMRLLRPRMVGSDEMGSPVRKPRMQGDEVVFDETGITVREPYLESRDFQWGVEVPEKAAPQSRKPDRIRWLAERGLDR